MKIKRTGFLGAISGVIAAVLAVNPLRAASAPPKPSLKVWWDGDHWVCAESAADAAKVLEEAHGGALDERDIRDLGLKPWEEWKNTVPTICYEDIDIAGLNVVGGKISGSPQAWASAIGRGLIGSAECCNAY